MAIIKLLKLRFAFYKYYVSLMKGTFLLFMECLYLCFGLRNNLLNFCNGLLFSTLQNIGLIVILSYLNLM